MDEWPEAAHVRRVARKSLASGANGDSADPVEDSDNIVLRIEFAASATS